MKQPVPPPKMSAKWDEEVEAGEILRSRLGGTVIRRDPGGGAVQLHDLDIRLPDGRVIAVEVTRHTVPRDVAARAAVTKHKWCFAELSSDWVVDMAGAPRIAAVHKKIAPLLATLESEGVDAANLGSLDRLDDDPPDHQLPEGQARRAGEALDDLGARLVYRLTRAGPEGGEVIISEAGRIGATSPEVVVGVIEGQAALGDNVAKLSRAVDAAERHLFVWVESPQHHAVAAIRMSHLPERSPKLHGCIDAAWVATAYDPARIWRYHIVDGWTDQGTWKIST